MAYESIKYHNLEGASFEQTPSLCTWVENDIVWDFDPEDGENGPQPQDQDDEKNWMVEAYMKMGGGELWAIGDPHPIYTEAVCQNVKIVPKTIDTTTHLMAISTFAMPGKFSQVQYDTYQQTTTRNYDASGALTECRFDPQSSGGSPSINFKIPYVANIQVPQIMQSIRVVQYETLPPSTWYPAKIADSNIAVWNKTEFRGYKPGSLLYVGTKSSTEGTRLYRRETMFLNDNIRGFAYYYAVWVDSRGLIPGGSSPVIPYKPGDLSADGLTDYGLQSRIYAGGSAASPPLPQSVISATDHNGASAFVMMNSVDFNTVFNGLRPPFGIQTFQ